MTSHIYKHIYLKKKENGLQNLKIELCNYH